MAIEFTVTFKTLFQTVVSTAAQTPQTNSVLNDSVLFVQVMQFSFVQYDMYEA